MHLLQSDLVIWVEKEVKANYSIIFIKGILQVMYKPELQICSYIII
jgi:hypothetical protein